MEVVQISGITFQSFCKVCCAQVFEEYLAMRQDRGTTCSFIELRGNPCRMSEFLTRDNRCGYKNHILLHEPGSRLQFLLPRRHQVHMMRSFESLTEREILALAIFLE